MELNWTDLLRDAGSDPDAVLNVWDLARVHEPENEGLLRRIAAQGRAARKTADRLAAEKAGGRGPAPAKASPRKAAAPVAAPVDTAPADSSSRYDPAAEAAAFVRDVRAAVLDSSRGAIELTDEQAHAALGEWRTVVAVDGQPWHYGWSPGWTAVQLGNWLCAKNPNLTPPVPLAGQSPVWAMATDNRVLRYLGWTLPERCPQPGQTVIELDINAQYLAAMRSVRLGDGEPIVLDDLTNWTLDDLVKRPGWLTLDQAPDLAGLPTYAQAAFASVQPSSSLPTPLAAYLVQNHGVALSVSRAVIWDRKTVTTAQGHPREVNAYGPRLSRLAEEIAANRVRLADRAAGDPDHPAAHARTLLKTVYSRFSSGFLRSTDHNLSEWLRPDWADQIAALASANSLRALDKAAAAGFEPFGQALDSVWWVVDADPADVPAFTPPGLELSAQPGKWHLNRWGRADEALIAAVSRGRFHKVSIALAAIDTARRATEAPE